MPGLESQDIKREICAFIANGGTLIAWCRERGGSPKTGTVRRWLRDDEVFAKAFEQAERDRSKHLAEETILIADDSGTDMGDQQKAKLRIETRWKLIKAENPAMGETVKQEVTSPDGSMKPTVSFDLSKFSAEDLRKIVGNED